MKRTPLWLGTTIALTALGLGVMPAAAAPPAVAAGRQVRSVPPRTSPLIVAPTLHHRIDRSTPLSGAPVSSAPVPVPQVAPRTRGIPVTVPTFTVAPTPVPTPTPAPDIFHISQQQILINQDRASNGALAGLAWSPCLAAIALQNAQRIAAQGYLSHTNGPTLDLACDPNYTTAGENIAYTSAGANDAQVNTMFMNSAPHRANILNGAYRFVGTAWVVTSNGYGYIAVEFAG